MRKVQTDGRLRRLWQLSWPAIAEQLLVTMVSYVDTAMVGVLGAAGTAAVSVNAAPLWLGNGLLTGVGVGYSVQLSNAVGAGDDKRARAILRQGVPVVVERAEAVAVWAWNALHTERFLWPCFSANYGSEIYTLIGQGYQPETKRAEVQRYIEECLLACPYITAVTGMTVTGAGDRLTVSFTIRSIYGDLDMEVETDAG